MDETETPFPLPPEPKSSRLITPILAVLVLVVVVASGTFIWWRWMQFNDTEVAVDPEGERLEVDVEAVNQAFADGRSEEVLQDMERVLAEDSDNVQALTFTAATWAQRGQFEYREDEFGPRAVELAERALEVKPNDIEALRILGYALEMQNQWQQAIDVYNQAVALRPEQGDLYAHRGHAKDLAGDFAGAKEDYTRALELDPQSMLAVENMARIYMREGDFRQARDLLLTVAERTDSRRLRAETYFNLSSVAMYLDEDMAASLEWANKAVAEDPGYPLGYVGQARVYVIHDEREAASQALTKAFEIYPDLAGAYEWLGIAYSNTGQFSEAIGVFRRGREALARDIHLMDNEREALRGRFDFYLAGLLAREGDTDAAIAALRESVVEARADIVTMRMLENGFHAGQEGPFAPLIGLPGYEEVAVHFVSQTPSAERLSRNIERDERVAEMVPERRQSVPLVQSAEAGEVINLCPHCEPGGVAGPGLAFDSMITDMLRQYVNDEIERQDLFNQCDAAIFANSGGRFHCQITREAATGVITVSCSNYAIARYIPVLPVAVIDAPGQQCVDGDIIVNGGQSHDPDGAITAYHWTVTDPNGQAVPVPHTQASFGFPATVPGTYRLRLTVTDNESTGQLQHATESTVQVVEGGICDPVPPVAVIDIPEAVCFNAPIAASGLQSFDPDGTITGYQWSVTDPQGEVVSVATNAAEILFNGVSGGEFRTQLTVTDNDGETNTAVEHTEVGNRPPVAAILVDETEDAGGQTVYTLDGSTSFDPDFEACGDTITYEWEVVDSSGVNPSPQEGSTTESTFTFTATEGEDYNVLLRVFDPNGASDSATALLTADGVLVTPTPSPSPSASPSASPSSSQEVGIDGGIFRETD